LGEKSRPDVQVSAEQSQAQSAGMADIGKPERVIEVRPAESPMPRELPLEPSEPARREPAPVEEPERV
jgi:hypothetical protein